MPADEVIKGVSEFTEQPLQRVFTTGSPTKTVRTFIGPQALSDAKSLELMLSYEVQTMNTQKGVPAIITIETIEDSLDGSTAETHALAEVTWSLDWEREMKDIKAHGYFTESGVSAGAMEAIDLAIKKGTAAATDWDAAYSMTHLNVYRDLRLLGVNSYMFFAPLVSATLSLGRFTKFKAPKVPCMSVCKWSEISIPLAGGAAYTPEVGGIEQPQVINMEPSGGSYADPTWATIDIDDWLKLPVKRNYTRSSKKYDLIFEWLGAESWNKALYYGGKGLPWVT
jgi:hypothetical protein